MLSSSGADDREVRSGDGGQVCLCHGCREKGTPLRGVCHGVTCSGLDGGTARLLGTGLDGGTARLLGTGGGVEGPRLQVLICPTFSNPREVLLMIMRIWKILKQLFF